MNDFNSPGLRTSQAFNTFSHVAFAVAATLMLVFSTVGITKALRDKEEGDHLPNKLDKARTERLLVEVSQSRQ